MAPYADPTTCDGTLAILVHEGSAARPGRSVMFCAASMATREMVSIMVTHARGICTVTVSEAVAMRLGIMIQGQGALKPNDQPYYGVSVEASDCTETGISAAERAMTMRTLGRPDIAHGDVVSPGHVMVQIARNVLRTGASLPEIANALLAANRVSRFSGWIDILNDDGDLASPHEARILAQKLGLACFEADAAHASARERLREWMAVTDFNLTISR
ncbi:3,4-dihydroxy-2-butanone-4-phosphate synthase [Blastomonas fulva]|uniref:3,4-dihydroxy-2-butanone-4-phosphate synthase n=1 Tax=Blastomonas fulva TaxID=1550728 RepID=UPI003F6EB3D3